MEPESSHKLIADDIIDITYALDEYIDSYNYSYLYSYFPAVSANYIQQYICKVIDFFRSWKTHLLGINTIYRFGDPFENTVKILEDQFYKIKIHLDSPVHIQDSVKINPIDSFSPSGDPYPDLFGDDFITISHRYNDHVKVTDRLRIISRFANKVVVSEHTDNMHVFFHDVNHKVTTNVKDDNVELNINTDRASFYADDNDLHLVTEETDHTVYDAQILNELTHMTKDTIDWRLIDDGKGQDTLS
jgi:hypothetical protein